MTATDLRDVWCADIDGTDMRVQADGKWLPQFAADPGVTQDLIFSPLLPLRTEPIVMPSVAVSLGNLHFPSSPDTFWAAMDNIWLGYAAKTINDIGMWPPANIGWAPSAPITWQLTAPRARPPAMDSEGNISFSFGLSRNTGFRFGVGTRSFIDAENDSTKLWTNIGVQGMVFVHYDYSSTLKELSLGVLGTTWLPAAGVHIWDFFSGEPQEAIIRGSDADGVQHEVTADLATSASRHMIIGGTQSTSRFQVPSRERYFGERSVRTSAAMFWKELSITASSETGFFEDENTDLLSLQYKWKPVGEAGIDMLGSRN